MEQNSIPKVSAIVLAAGVGSRMGYLKQLARVGGKPLLYYALQTIRQAKLDEVIVVLGFAADQIASEVSLEGTKVLINPSYAEGMGGTLNLALSCIGESCDAAIVFLADQPMVLPSTISTLVAAYQRSRPPAVIPVYNGRRGNPVLLDRSLFSKASQLKGDEGFRSVLGDLPAVLSVDVDDPGILLDVDTPEDLERCREHFERWKSVKE